MSLSHTAGIGPQSILGHTAMKWVTRSTSDGLGFDKSVLNLRHGVNEHRKGKTPCPQGRAYGGRCSGQTGAAAALGVFAQIGLHLRRLNGSIPSSKSRESSGIVSYEEAIWLL